MSIFKGLSAFPITPASQSGKVATDDLCKLLERITKKDMQSIGLLGSTGTYMFLNRQERERATSAAVECVAGRLPIIVGVGAMRTDEAIALAQDAEKAGANGLLLAPVSYTPLTAEEVYTHFLAVAGATGLPICIYNNPGTTKFSFGADLIGKLAEINNIAAVKMPLPPEMKFDTDLKQLREGVPDEFVIGYSGDWGCAPGMLAGADAWYSVISGILPDVSAKLGNAAFSGNAEEAAKLTTHFQPMWDLFKEFGSLRVAYRIAHVLELTDKELPRPLLPVPGEANARIDAALAKLEKVCSV